jgi:rare lipoprotein A
MLLGCCLLAFMVTACGVIGVAESPKVSSRRVSQPSDRHPANVSQHTVSPANPAVGTFDGLMQQYEESSVEEQQLGTASYYADSLAGHKMANGEAYDPSRPTMAHRTLPFGTVVRVVRISTGATVVVQVTDRGPFGKRQRIADVSREAARRLGMLRDGVVDVRLEVLSRGQRVTSKSERSR